MSNFWNTIDDNYFCEVKETDVLEKISSIQTKKVQLSEPEFENCLPKGLVEKVERVFKKEFLAERQVDEVQKKSHQNFMKHCVVSLLSYSKIIDFLKKKISPCELCLKRMFQILSAKFQYPVIFTGEEKHDLKTLDAESRNLSSIISKKLPLFCQKCSEMLNLESSNQPISKAYPLLEAKSALKANSGRLSYLILSINKRILNENRMISKTSIAFEIEVQKEFLFTTLIRIEQKLLAESIYKVNSVYKSQIAEIEFIGYPTPFTIPLNELKFWNNFRESSLFKIHKVGFKCHSSFYSFNVS
jgi:hypothetical protein